MKQFPYYLANINMSNSLMCIFLFLQIFVKFASKQMDDMDIRPRVNANIN